MKKALITGITGQDGSYLAEFLLEKNYQVFGMVRRSTSSPFLKIEHLLGPNQNKRLQLVEGDLGDSSSLYRLVEELKPDEIYNLAAQSHIKLSFDIAEYTGDITGLGTVRILDAIRKANLGNCRFYQASSSELFGKCQVHPQNELTPFHPRNPYAAAKAYSFYMTRNYRESYGLFAVNGILYNHESPRRGENYVTRKITLGLAKIKCGLQEKLYLGNLDAKRDWGHAKDYVRAMWLMLQSDIPNDYVISTGQVRSVKDFLEKASEYLKLDWESVVEIDHRHFRPAEVDVLVGDSKRAREELGWKPEISFDVLVKEMVDADLNLVRQQMLFGQPLTESSSQAVAAN